MASYEENKKIADDAIEAVKQLRGLPGALACTFQSGRYNLLARDVIAGSEHPMKEELLAKLNEAQKLTSVVFDTLDRIVKGEL